MIVNPRVLLLRSLLRVVRPRKERAKGKESEVRDLVRKERCMLSVMNMVQGGILKILVSMLRVLVRRLHKRQKVQMKKSPALVLNGLLPSQLHVLLGGGELSCGHASPCDETMFDSSPIRVDMSVGDDMLFDFAFEGDTWLIEAEYDSDWLAVVQPMCELCDASDDDDDDDDGGAWTEEIIRLDSTWCPPFMPGVEPATHTANGAVEEDVMSKSRLESKM